MSGFYFFLFLFAEEHEPEEQKRPDGADARGKPGIHRADGNDRRDEDRGDDGENNSERFQKVSSFPGPAFLPDQIGFIVTCSRRKSQEKSTPGAVSAEPERRCGRGNSSSGQNGNK